MECYATSLHHRGIHFLLQIPMNVKKELQSVTLMPHVPTQWDHMTVPVSMAIVGMDSTVPVRYLFTVDCSSVL